MSLSGRCKCGAATGIRCAVCMAGVCKACRRRLPLDSAGVRGSGHIRCAESVLKARAARQAGRRRAA